MWLLILLKVKKTKKNKKLAHIEFKEDMRNKSDGL